VGIFLCTNILVSRVGVSDVLCFFVEDTDTCSDCFGLQFVAHVEQEQGTMYILRPTVTYE
jgi:hypothetical protein